MIHPGTRIRKANEHPIRPDGDFVLYWMQTSRRLAWNHSLDTAIRYARELRKPLVVYEGLRSDYPWNSERIHRFILEGFIDNAETAHRLGITYWPYVETPENPARGLLAKITQKACLVVTDDFPCYIIPEQIANLARKIEVSLLAVDDNGIIPLSQYTSFSTTARSLRIKIHKLFADSYLHLPLSEPANEKKGMLPILPYQGTPPFRTFSCTLQSVQTVLSQISFANSVRSNPSIRGGRKEGLRLLDEFVNTKIARYAEFRSPPAPQNITPVSHLSAYLHFGFISASEIVQRVLDISQSHRWAPDLLVMENRGQREGFFSSDPAVNAFLDELLTWRDIGYQWFWQKPSFRKGFEDLPEWAKQTRAIHDRDKREFLYSREDLFLGKTHDLIWNAGQKELRFTGRMHNYIRMLWGKKIIEWSPSWEEALGRMEEFNNLLAYDGRNPNSYTGFLWCFGMFDRPWFPERKVLGTVRYMSSDSTRKKFRLQPYLDYVNGLEGGQENLF